jgi:hypothetical protein
MSSLINLIPPTVYLDDLVTIIQYPCGVYNSYAYCLMSMQRGGGGCYMQV